MSFVPSILWQFPVPVLYSICATLYCICAVLLQVQPNVVVVSSKTDDTMQRTLHSYGRGTLCSARGWGVFLDQIHLLHL